MVRLASSTNIPGHMDNHDDIVTLWYHYEEIAMHFNSLIMQFRLQVMGGAGAIGAVSGYLIGGKVTDVKQQNWLRALVSSDLLLLILSAAILDIAYYNQLLRGAVDALLAFETQHPEIQLSTQIEAAVGNGKFAVWWAYGLMLGTLGIFVVWAWTKQRAERDLPETRQSSALENAGEGT